MEVIRKILKDNSKSGPAERLNRFSEIVPTIANTFSGGIIEYGGGLGECTDIFLRTGKPVWTVDPWPEYFDGGKNVYTKERFLSNLSMLLKGEYKQLNMIDKDSNDSDARRILQENTPYCFGFADGDQSTIASVILDIASFIALDIPVICVDDYGTQDARGERVRKAVDAFDGTHEIIHEGRAIECYMIRK